MDPEKRLRRQGFRVIVSEMIMVLTVAIMVIVLAFVVSGYWLGSDFKVERQGMLQISSVPTGAEVEINGESSWMQRTNTNKILSSGEHEIKLTKEGYDSWSKTITVKEGLLYRLYYPRLFLTEREKEPVYDAKSTTFATVSPNHNSLLLIDETTTWSLLKLDSDKVEASELDVSSVLGLSSGLFTGHIIKADWSHDNNHILFEIDTDGKKEWIVVDVRNVANSVNLTREFETQFDKIRITDNSANNLLALKDGSLNRIDVSGKQVSVIVAEDVNDFDFLNQEIVFSAKFSSSSIELANSAKLSVDENGEELPENLYYVGLKKIDDANYITVTTTPSPARPVIGKFYNQDFIGVLIEDQFTLYEKPDFKPIMSDEVSFVPKNIKVGHGGDFIIMSDGGNIATLDMEAMAISTWSTDTDNFGWLDGSMVYAVKDGVLNVYDYDGLNHRTLSEDIDGQFPITITDNKWLYYFSDNQLVRELIVK